MGIWLRWGAVLLGAISLFSLAHERYAFALVPVIQDALDHYRSCLNHGLDVASLKWPGIPSDLIVIYLVLGVLLLWFYLFDDLEWSQSSEETITLWSLLGRNPLAS